MWLLEAVGGSETGNIGTFSDEFRAAIFSFSLIHVCLVKRFEEFTTTKAPATTMMKKQGCFVATAAADFFKCCCVVKL